jgi:hypothetical protein
VKRHTRHSLTAFRQYRGGSGLLLLTTALFVAGTIGTPAEAGERKHPLIKVEMHKDDYGTGIGDKMIDSKTGGWWFNLGPTGARGRIAHANPKAFKIMYVFESSPAHGKLKKGDLVVGVNGKKFQEADELKI